MATWTWWKCDPGSVVYSAGVHVEGGYLYLGDAHAAMGHGELSATGLEMAAESKVTVDVVKGKAVARARESPRDDEIMTASPAVVRWSARSRKRTRG